MAVLATTMCDTCAGLLRHVVIGAQLLLAPLHDAVALQPAAEQLQAQHGVLPAMALWLQVPQRGKGGGTAQGMTAD